MTKKILVAVDDTEASQRAAAFVEEFFQGHEVSLTALKVARTPVEWMPASPYGPVAAWPHDTAGDSAATEDAFARQKARTAEVADSQGPEGAAVEVGFGDPAEAIVIAADNMEADMIVVGSHDKSVLDRLFRGSVSEEVVRKAPRPVLVVPEAPEASEEPAG